MAGLLGKQEIPAAISQGKTIGELKNNLLDVLKLILVSNKELTEKEYLGKPNIPEESQLI